MTEIYHKEHLLDRAAMVAMRAMIALQLHRPPWPIAAPNGYPMLCRQGGGNALYASV